MKRQLNEAFDAAIAQDIASILLAGPPSPAWQSFVTAAHDAGESLPPVIQIDLIQDVIQGHRLHEAIAWLFGDGVPPTMDVQSVSVAENSPIAASSLITSLSNPSNNDITYYDFYDAGRNGYFTVNGVAEPDGQWICVPANNLSNVDYVGGSAPGSETLHVKAYDATRATWVGYSSLTATTDVVPAVNVQNVAIAENASIAAASLIASISNPSNGSITYYGFYDAGGSGHFTLNGVAEPDGQWLYVPASNLGAVDYVGGAAPGSDTLNIEVYDATTSTWSVSSALTATTYDVAPTVNVQSVSVAENTAIAAASLITSISNPSNDSITCYGFYDAGGSGHFTLNGVAEPDGQWIYVPAGNLGTVDYVGGASPGSDTITIEAYDATASTWSTSSRLTATTTGNAFSLQYKGFDYPAFYNGAYENSDLLPTLVQTGANSVEVTLDYGINAQTSQVVADPNYTDSLTALGDTIAQAESLGISVMVRPLIDFLNPAESAPYSVGDWREYYQPANVATFFASYQQMIVAEAEVAQENGAQMFCIGTELDQLTGPQYLPYWTDIINAVRAVYSGPLTYSASWTTASEVSFWNQLNYEGIDCYVPLSNHRTRRCRIWSMVGSIRRRRRRIPALTR